jgi:hypothetical protein
MKILIISLPRTGSTSLTNRIAKDNNLKPILEPFDVQNRVIYSGEDDVVLKTLIDQTHPIGKQDYVNYWFNKSIEFDKVILLSRKDLKACAESMAYLDYNQQYGYQYNQKYEWYLTPNFNKFYKHIIRMNDELHKLSKLLNIKITYYEDMFDLNSEERLRIGNIKLNKLI